MLWDTVPIKGVSILHPHRSRTKLIKLNLCGTNYLLPSASISVARFPPPCVQSLQFVEKEEMQNVGDGNTLRWKQNIVSLTLT